MAKNKVLCYKIKQRTVSNKNQSRMMIKMGCPDKKATH